MSFYSSCAIFLAFLKVPGSGKTTLARDLAPLLKGRIR